MVRSVRLGADDRQLEPAERLPVHQRSCDLAVDVQIITSATKILTASAQTAALASAAGCGVQPSGSPQR